FSMKVFLVLGASPPQGELPPCLHKTFSEINHHRASHQVTHALKIPHYLVAGLSALRCIMLVLEYLRTDPASIRSVLDLPSGGGRVLRFLRTGFPDATLVACDTNEALVEFCGKAFGARVTRSTPDINQLHLPGSFDLIWCGSLLTHFDET